MEFSFRSIVYHVTLLISLSLGIIQLLARTEDNTFPIKSDDEDLNHERMVFLLNGIAILVCMLISFVKIVTKSEIESMYDMWLHHMMTELPFMVMFSLHINPIAMGAVFTLACYLNMTHECALIREREIFNLKLEYPTINIKEPGKEAAADIQQSDVSSVDTTYSEVRLENIVDTSGTLSETYKIWPISSLFVSIFCLGTGLVLPIFLWAYHESPTYMKNLMVMHGVYTLNVHIIHAIISRMPTEKNNHLCNVSRNMFGISTSVIQTLIVAAGTGILISS